MTINCKNVFLVCISDIYYKNNIFDLSSPHNRDDSYYPYFLLKQEMSARGLQLNTYDYLDKTTAGGEDFALLFSDIPRDINVYLGKFPHINKYLLINESEVIIPRNWDLELHKNFRKIFTWNDDLIDNHKYFKSNFANRFPSSVPKDLGVKSKLCTLIAFNKKSRHPLELYSKREEAIRWFEINHPDDFDLYGIGWDEYTFSGPRLIRMLNRIKPLKRIFAHKYITYRGRVERKYDILRRYKFSICYENVRDLTGWITEKIFDCFFAGCIPVYWGAGNVTTHIPEDCFIDKRKFPTYEALYDFMTAMNDSTYLNYLDRIDAYLRSPHAYQYTAEYFAKTIANEILND